MAANLALSATRRLANRASPSLQTIKTTPTPHLRISSYKGSVATVQIEMLFHVIQVNKTFYKLERVYIYRVYIVYCMMHQALDDSDQTRKYGISDP